MTDKEIQEKATEWIRSQGWNEENLPNDEYCQMCDAFLAGAKIMQKENDAYWQNIITEQHIIVDVWRRKTKEENERLAKRICELQSDLSREKSTVKGLRRCSNCIHRFVIHYSQAGTCQKPGCKNYSEWCSDFQFLERMKSLEGKE